MEKYKRPINIMKIQDREEIFQHGVRITSDVSLGKEKVGVPDHLFSSRIAGPAGRRDPATVTQINITTPCYPILTLITNDIVFRMPP